MLLMHAFARAPEDVRETALRGFCGAEACCSASHPILQSAAQAAAWAKAHDPACAPLGIADLERIMCIVALNAFGLLADIQAAAKPPIVREGRLLRYDEAVQTCDEAVDYLSTIEGLAFTLSLGDIVDGRDDLEATMADLAPVLASLATLLL